MQGIHNYIPETNHISRVYSDAAVLCLQFMLNIMLFRPCNMVYYYVMCFSRSSTSPYMTQ